MKCGGRHVRAEIYIHYVHLLCQFPYLIHGRTIAQNPRNNLERSNIIFFFHALVIECVPLKVKTGNANALVICSLEIKWETASNYTHSNHCRVVVNLSHLSELKWIIGRSDNRMLSESYFQIQVSSKVILSALIINCCTHIFAVLSCKDSYTHTQQ